MVYSNVPSGNINDINCTYDFAVIHLEKIQGITSTITVVDGVSTNVNILCNLDEQANTILYWNISGLVFDLSSIPDIFVINGHESITIPAVDRRMDNWTFQCCTVNPTGVNLGITSSLRVLYGKSIRSNYPICKKVIIGYFCRPITAINTRRSP